MPEEIRESGLTRRHMIQTTAIGAVGVWSAPAVLSVGASAFAASQACDCSDGNNCLIGNCSDPNDFCSCAATVEGPCGCFIPTCVAPSCTSSADCDNGQLCVPGCCSNPVCATPCGGPAPSSVHGQSHGQWGR
jgi:hypothetical protein